MCVCVCVSGSARMNVRLDATECNQVYVINITTQLVVVVRCPNVVGYCSFSISVSVSGRDARIFGTRCNVRACMFARLHFALLARTSACPQEFRDKNQSCPCLFRAPAWPLAAQVVGHVSVARAPREHIIVLNMCANARVLLRTALRTARRP